MPVGILRKHDERGDTDVLNVPLVGSKLLK
jgi:hypothetical protein